MDRKRLEPELSLHLDGRLPSGRRERLLDQLDSDLQAAGLLDEMERAQTLARSLPEVQVSSGFTEGLWQRIRAGEGTPEAVFREPLPWLVKARYLLTGAAAAAAVLVGASFLAAHLREDGSPQSGGSPENLARGSNAEPKANESELVAGTSAPDGTDTRRTLRPSPGAMSSAGLYPISAFSVAQAGQNECVEAIHDLKFRAPSVASRLDPTQLRDVVGELEPVVDRARTSAGLMRWLQTEKMIQLPSEFDVALSLTEQILGRIERAHEKNDATEMRVAVEDIDRLDVGPLHRDFEVICCRDPHEFLARFSDRFVQDPGLRRSVHIVLNGNSMDLQLRPPGEFQNGPLPNGWVEVRPRRLRIEGFGLGGSGVQILEFETSEAAPAAPAAPAKQLERSGR